ncbi:MAG: hypothetical protein LBV60_16895 [Streptomyces sp.]|nr:hypothetical protein [Streptomyces sp.]
MFDHHDGGLRTLLVPEGFRALAGSRRGQQCGGVLGETGTFPVSRRAEVVSGRTDASPSNEESSIWVSPPEPRTSRSTAPAAPAATPADVVSSAARTVRVGSALRRERPSRFQV